jgi:O-Antigen ligase
VALGTSHETLDDRSRRPTAPLVLLLLAVFGIVVAAVLAGGGSSNANLFPLGIAAVAILLAASVATLAGLLPRPNTGRSGVVCVVSLALLCLWTGLSIVWSIAPDLSWDALNRSLVYLALLCLGAFAGAATRRAATDTAAGLGILIAAALVWALLAKVFPGLDEDGGRIARLRVPVDFWNALAVVFVLGMPIALWLATDRDRRPATRAGAVVFLYGLIVGLLLTYSRGGILAGALALVIWLVFSRERLESVVALAVAGLLAAGVFAFALRLPGVVDDGQDMDVRVADGRALGLALALGALVVLGLAYAAARAEARRPVTGEERAKLGRLIRLAAVVAVAAGIVVLGVRGPSVANWVERQADEFANPPTELVTQSSSRLTSISSNNRWTWWNEAWEAFEGTPALGTGAASFATVHQILRQDTLTVTEPHSVPLQFLAETGIIGALLACTAGLAALVGCLAAVRRATATERAPALALAIGVLVYVAHSLVDFDWSFIAATAPVLVATGVLLASGRPVSRRRDSLALAPVGLLLAAAVGISLAAPWLSERKVNDAYAALGQNRAAAGLDAANAARSLDPLSLDPLFARANAQTMLGDLDGARASLVRAVELQPLDADAWYELGAFELQVAGRPNAALRYLERATELDPFGPASELAAFP